MDRRSFLLAAVALPSLTTLIAACGDPNAVPGDTAPTSTTASTAVPTSTAASTAVPASTPTSGPIAYPTGADDVVVRVAQVGGFVPEGVAFGQVPNLLITGDGRAFRPGVQTMEYPGRLLAPITLASITPAGIQNLLAVAQTEGLLVDPVPEYAPNAQVADAPTTEVDLQADGKQLVHRADALGIVPDAQGDLDHELTPARQHLLRFVDAAQDLPATVGAGEIGDEALWQPTAFRIRARPADPSTVSTDGPQPTTVAWPDGTGVRLADATTCAVGSGDALATALGAANTLTFFTEDGVTYQVSAIGQLPGSTC